MPIRKNPDSGIWWVDISSPGHPRIRRSTGTKDRKAAQEYHDKLKAQLWRTEMLGEEPDHTFDEAALGMLKLSEGQSDYAGKVRHVAYWRNALGGQTPIRSLTAGAIMKALPTQSQHRNRDKAPVSPATKNRYLATIKRILTLSAQWGWMDRAVALKKFREPAKRVRWEPPAVIHTLISNLSLEWMRDVCLFAVSTGMRESEVLSLPPTQVDLQQRTAWVTADGAKSGYARTVPLNEDAMSVVARRLPHAGKHIFTRPGLGGRISQIDARCFNRACRMTEITDFRFHDLRHTWASWHVQNGTPLMVLKELGGWETLEMVQRYAHLAPSHLANHASAVTFWSQPTASSDSYDAVEIATT